MSKKSLKIILNIIAIFAVFLFGILMLNTIAQYFSFRTDIGFLQFKQKVIHNQYWLSFFYVHIFSIVICLLAGLTQFSGQILKNHKKLHRIFGKIYVYNVLFINFPACFILAAFSNGGILGISGFLVQNLLWGYFTVIAVLSIRKRDIFKHKNFMILSYSVTTTAITFRIIKNLFYNETVFSYELFYGLNVWVSLLFNLGVAFLIISGNSKSLSLESNVINKNKE